MTNDQFIPEAPLAIRAAEAWSGVFGGRETDFHFLVTSTARGEVRGAWSLTAEDAVLTRRETVLSVEPGKPGTLAVRFELPAARAGIVLPMTLTVHVQAGREKARLEKRLWVFPDDPFAMEQEWVKGQRITLFDPVGETSRLFRDAKIPVAELRNAERLASLDEGVLIVGEGVSWARQQALPKLMVDLASRGVGVLALAPADGLLPLPGSDAQDMPSPAAMMLRRADVITELDKRLDAIAWPRDGRLQASGLQIAAERGRVVGRVVNAAEGWPWLECRFSSPRGRIIVCGFSLVEHWEAGPTPRYLFARMLKRLAEVDGDRPPGDHDRQPVAVERPTTSRADR